jgi:signal transduction histidine kinase
VELYFKGGDVFEKAANRQIAVYVWTGILVIVLILIAGGFATQAIGKQIRLNRMKNDFIATVSHELKTPLASMRLLVDTLLEGNVRDEAQANEYLRLTVKENERLSRMIENFLTFSRMERNKMAFTIVDTKPAAIASDAIESVKTKFAAHNCHLAVDFADDLPEMQADHDAIVTVLINLLDNACKYTTDDKRVSLRIFSDDGFVCFVVSDNGIGLARRHLRRIFDRFYQVDSSLARKAEGCGLGLSIVKFIVDAHKGKITVESKPGKGSAFTVRLPIGRKNGD